jgi:hypothetical protein
MKYFFAVVVEMINGFESYHNVFISAKTMKSAENKLKKSMKVWRGKGYEEDGYYFFDGGGIMVKGYVQSEIPKEHYQILIKY